MEHVSRRALERHLVDRFLPAGCADAAGEVLLLLLGRGWDAGDDVVAVPSALLPVESAVGSMDDGTQFVRVVDAVEVFDLWPLLPERLAWVRRHPSWPVRKGRPGG